MNKTWFFVSFFPLFILVVGPFTIFLTYGIAVAHGHVYPLWPYVSDTGTKPPESCIFTFCLSASSFFIFIIAYVRYREVSELMILKPSIKIRPGWNKAAFVIAILTGTGLNIVDSFQELNAFTTHFVGAVLCFFSGTSYFVLQTVFTRRMYPEEKTLFYIRLFLTTLNIISLIGTFTPVHSALEQFDGEDILLWSDKNGGYAFHLISTFSEWIMVLCFISYISTFYWDFKKFEMEVPVLKFKDINLSESESAASRNPKV